MSRTVKLIPTAGDGYGCEAKDVRQIQTKIHRRAVSATTKPFINQFNSEGKVEDSNAPVAQFKKPRR